MGVSESLVTQKNGGGTGLSSSAPRRFRLSAGPSLLLGLILRTLGAGTKRPRVFPEDSATTQKLWTHTKSFLATFLVFLRLLLCGVSSSGTAAAKKGGFFKLF